jgi:hypothetical protein
MLNAYILVILMHTAGVSTFSLQEFNSKESCELVRRDLLSEVIKENVAIPKILRCVPK